MVVALLRRLCRYVGRPSLRAVGPPALLFPARFRFSSGDKATTATPPPNRRVEGFLSAHTAPEPSIAPGEPPRDQSSPSKLSLYLCL
jgi:hypothetical protein